MSLLTLLPFFWTLSLRSWRPPARLVLFLVFGAFVVERKEMTGGVMRTQVVSALAACSGLPAFFQILARVLTGGLWRDPFVVARAIAFCAASGGLHLAGALFRHAGDPTPFAYNAMIRAHSDGPTPPESIRLFRRMLRRGIYPDKFAFPFLLRACSRSTAHSSHGDGEQCHALLLKHGFERDLHVQTSLLHMYASLGRTGCARRVFDEMPQRGTVTWNAIISGYAKMSETPGEGLLLLAAMAGDGVDINDDTLVAALLCCAGTGSLLLGKSVHGFMTRRRAGPWPVALASTLLRMYVKCGSLDGGEKVFDALHGRDVPVWTAMIGGLAEHGRGQQALRLFERMVAVEGLRPDGVTFTSVLHACSHSGLVDEGLKVFRDMAARYGVEHRVEHYGAVADLLGRAGRLEEARRLVQSMPIVPNQVVWGSLLRSCLVDEELFLGRQQQVVEEGLEGSLSGFCVEVSNAYARVGRWEEVGRVRRTMAERGLRKACGWSCVDVNGKLHRFLVGDTSSSLVMEICESLSRIMAPGEPPSFLGLVILPLEPHEWAAKSLKNTFFKKKRIETKI